jgi:hypothetical protein
MRILNTQVSSVMLRSKKLEIRGKISKLKEPSRMKTKQSAMKCEIEPNPSKDRAMPEWDNPSFWDEFTKSFSWQFNSYSYFKASTEELSDWAVETLGD